MKTPQMLLTTLLALGISSVACAQTTIPGTTGVPGIPGSPSSTSSTVPGQPSPSIGTVPSTTLPTTPAGTAPGTIYTPNSTSPTGTPGVLRSNQPAGVAPRNSSVRGTRRANTTNTPVRP
ncbi:MAG: hypothetical protein EOO63_03230 [Hymenobacter sp.]|nr:MAG: hypothetical protein EOO63_03230 [Hymenobacter sp.]